MPKISERSGLFLAALAAILFSAKAILAKLMYRYGVDATTVITLRLAFAGPVFGVIALLQQRRARLNGQSLSWRDVSLVILLGFLGYYLSSFLDNAKAGLSGSENTGNLALGSALCFAAACSYTVYLVLSGEIVQRLGSLRLVAYAMSVSTLLTALHFALFATQPLLHLPWPVYALSGANALFCTIIPVYLTMFSVQIIGAARTSQLSMLGPISLLFFGYFILHEHLSLLQLIGTGIVLIGVWRVMTPPVRV